MKTNMAGLKNKKIKKKVDPLSSSVRRIKKKVVKKITRKVTVLDLKKSKHNPIIAPAESVSWESKATFNPTALYHDDKVHSIYRAIGDNDISVLGYGRSSDGHSVDRGSKEIAYYSSRPAIKKGLAPEIIYSSGGGWGGGSEDPRLTLFGDQVYMIYTSFDGWGSVRMALTSISLNDFIERRWNWGEPVFISPPDEIHKNWVLFPEKISVPASLGKGKY